MGTELEKVVLGKMMATVELVATATEVDDGLTIISETEVVEIAALETVEKVVGVCEDVGLTDDETEATDETTDEAADEALEEPLGPDTLVVKSPLST